MNLESLIEKTIRDFEWEDHGLPEVEELGDEYAAALAVNIVRAMLLSQLQQEPPQINPADLKVELFPQGQTVLGPKSWIARITHIPSGYRASGLEAKSQLSAKASALDILRTGMVEGWAGNSWSPGDRL